MFIDEVIGRTFFNYIGGTIRGLVGSAWRIIFKKPKINFDEYINGFEHKEAYFTKKGYKKINSLLGAAFMLIIIIICIH